nr:uncharacterized protein LOC115260372 isoform X2 [Aedes albopictus]
MLRKNRSLADLKGSPRKGIARGFPGRGGIVAAECARLDIEGSTNSVGLGFRPVPISTTIEPLSSDVQLPTSSSQLSRSPSHNNSTKSDQK